MSILSKHDICSTWSYKPACSLTLYSEEKRFPFLQGRKGTATQKSTRYTCSLIEKNTLISNSIYSRIQNHGYVLYLITALRDHSLFNDGVGRGWVEDFRGRGRESKKKRLSTNFRFIFDVQQNLPYF